VTFVFFVVKFFQSFGLRLRAFARDFNPCNLIANRSRRTMAQRYLLWSLAAALLICVGAISPLSASDFFVGCRTRPACGKVCKLVCETKKITAVCYGCECTEICIPSHSRRGCKHCESCCGEECYNESCCGDACANCECEGRGCLSCQDKGPECKFCWYDWVACGCAKPRTVKVLTKYEAEKEISWYHWEVVDAAKCYEEELPAEETAEETAADDAPSTNPVVDQIYKPAPAEARVGDVLPLSDSERAQLTSFLTIDGGTTPQAAADTQPPQVAPESASPVVATQSNKPSLIKKLGGLFRK
jgi:hypothetical protein